jgi:hypothetical protein
MGQIIERDGKQYVFPDSFTPAQIEAEINKTTITTSAQTNNTTTTQTPKPEDDKRGFLTDIPLQVIGGIRDGVQSGINLVESLNENTNMGGLVFGENARNGVVDWLTTEQMKEKNLRFIGSGEIGVKDAVKLPEVDKADTIAGSLTRGISQFVTGWYTVKPLKLFSAGTRLGKFAGSTAQGAAADIIAFDEDTGRAVDTIVDVFPSLQNPVFEYLSSEGKNETWYEARLKNALEGGIFGTVIEGAVLGAKYAPDVLKSSKDQVVDFVKYIKIRRKELAGEAVDVNKLKELEESLINSVENQITPTGKASTKKLVEKIVDEASTTKVGEVFEDIKLKTNSDELNNKIVNSFDEFINSARDPNTKTLDWRKLSESLDFKLSPRAYADTDFGIIVLDAIQKVVRSEKKFDVITDKIIELQANKAGGDIIQTTKMLGQLGDKLESGLKYMWASQAIQQNIADALYKMAKSIANNEKIYTESDAKLTTALLMRLSRFDEKVTSNLGRGLRLRGVLKDSNVDLSKDSIINLVRNFDNYKGNFNEFLNSVALVKDKNALIKVTDFIVNNKFWNVANEVWMIANLSVPKTHFINTLSTGLNLFMKPIDLIVGSKLTWGLDPATAKAVKSQLDTGLSLLAGYKNYLADGLRFAKKAFAEEDSVLFGGSTKFDTSTKALGTSEYAKLARVPLRALTATDEFFKQVAYRARLTEIAVKEAKEAGVSTTKIVGKLPNGKEISEFEQYVATRIRNGYDETGLIGVDAVAKRYAQEVTFTKDLDGILGHVQSIVNEAPILKMVLPFVKTPANLAIQAIERSPLGVFGKNWENFSGSSRDAYKIAETRGRIAVGTAILTSTALLNFAGLITGGYHPDKSIRQQQQSMGFQPYSIKIPFTDTYVQYGRLDPFGMLIGTIADYSQIYHDLNDTDRMKIENRLYGFLDNQMKGGGDNLGLGTKVTNMVTSTYKSVFRNVGSKTYLRSLIDFLSSFDENDVDRKGAWWLTEKGASFVPNILTKISNDPYLRDAQTLTEKAREKLGDRTLPKVYNFLGEPIVNNQNALFRLFNSSISPASIKGQKDDVLLKETIENEINIPALEKVKNGIDLTQFVNKNGETAYEVWNNLIAKSNLRKDLEQTIKGKDYQNSPPTITFDENNKNWGGKSVILYDKVKQQRDLSFLNIQYGDFYSKSNKELSLSEAYINKGVIKDISGATNKIPSGFTRGIYNFIDKTK